MYNNSAKANRWLAVVAIGAALVINASSFIIQYAPLTWNPLRWVFPVEFICMVLIARLVLLGTRQAKVIEADGRFISIIVLVFATMPYCDLWLIRILLILIPKLGGYTGTVVICLWASLIAAKGWGLMKYTRWCIQLYWKYDDDSQTIP